MAIPIPTNQIQNLQQIESVVAGPDGANRLFIVTGQTQAGFTVFSQGANPTQQKETFTILLGPTLTRQQFFRAIGTASVAQATIALQSATGGSFSWGISSIDADWDDESGQVELRVEVVFSVSGQNNFTTLGGLSFQVTILAAVAG